MSILLLIKKKNWIQNTGWFNLYLLKKQKKQNETKKNPTRIRSPGCWREDQETSKTRTKNSENKAGCVRVWFEWGTY